MHNTRQGFSIVLGLAALALLGYLLLPRLNIRWQPGPPRGQLSVSYSMPAAAPGVVERLVTSPLEASFALLEGVEKIESASRRGNGRIELELDPERDPDFLRFTVAAAIRRIYPELPEGVTYPTIDYSSPEEDEQGPVLVYTLSGPDAPSTLANYAREQLLPQLSQLSQLERVELSGGNVQRVSIRIDPEQLGRLGIGRADLVGQLRQYFQRSGLGIITSRGDRLYAYLGVAEQLDLSVTNWGQIPISLPRDAAINRQYTLADIAQISLEEQPPAAYYRLNGANNLRLLVYGTQTANQLELAADFSTLATRVATQLPSGYVLQLEKDNTEFLRRELDQTRRRTALSIGILLLFVLLAYRNWRKIIVIFSGLAINLGLALLCYYWLEVELNLYAFAGVAVSFGIMIDNLLIMVDALHRKGEGRAEIPAILGATLTSMAGLCVIFFLGEELRHQLFELTRVMLINLGLSVVVAVFFVPALDKRLKVNRKVVSKKAPSPPRPMGKAPYRHSQAGGEAQTTEHERTERPLPPPSPPLRLEPTLEREPLMSSSLEEAYENLAPSKKERKSLIDFYALALSFLLRFRKTALLAVLLGFGLPVFLLPRQVEGWEGYNRSIGSDYYQEVLRPHVNRWLGGSLRLFSYYVYEGGGFRRAEETRLYVRAALPEGATVHQLNEVLLIVERYLATFGSQIASFSTSVYSGQSGYIEIQFPDNATSFPFTLKNRLTAYATNFGGMEWDIYGVGQGFSTGRQNQMSAFRVELRGFEQTGLDGLAGQLAENLLQHPRIQEVNTDANLEWWQKDRTEYRLSYQPPALALAGFSPTQLYTTLEWFDRSPQPDFYLTNGTGVAIQPKQPERFDRWNAENRSIASDSSRLQFSQFAELTARPAAQALFKENQEYLRLVTFDYLGSSRFGSRYLDKCLDTLKADMPLGYTISRPSYRPDEELRDWSGAVGLAVLLIFFICALLFESLRQAFSIIMLIPVTFIGVFLTFYWFDVQLDQGGYTSFLLVSGLAVNGMILIVNNYNGLVKTGQLIGIQAFARAATNKLLPISLTVLSTVAGLLPFLLGTEKAIFWHALAAGTIGGLIFSIFVLLFICPLFFLKKPGPTFLTDFD